MESNQTHVELEVFQGPLDLLLYLITKNEINIYDIPIATITQQYLDHLELMQELNLNVAADFIMLAVQLIEMKIRMLLPKPPAELELEDDLRRPLVEQLLEYQKFKLAAQSLKDKEERTAQYWPRPATFDAEANREELVEANLYDLVHAFALLIKRTGRRAELEIRADQFSVKQKIQELLEYLEVHEHFSLMEYAKSLQSRGEMIVLFLAILEMIRLSMMRIFQGETFGDILIYRQIVSENEAEE